MHDHHDNRPSLIYCDEDHLAADGRTRSQPIFKPAWSPEMLLGYDYMGRLTLIRRDLMEQAGGFDSGMGEAAEWDLKLRVTALSDRVIRVTRCLYHNRSDTDVRPVCRGGEQARAALKAHLVRLGIEGGDATLQLNGTFRVYWPLAEYPLVSIVVPTVDNPRRIERCVRGLVDETSYPNKEIILVDNGSTDAETLALYDQWKASGVVKLVPFDRPFNYSAACNAGAAVASGQYLLFLNNDIEFVSADWLEELMRWAQRPDVGVVGPKMVYPNGTVNHAAGIAVTLTTYVNLYQKEVGDCWGILGHVDSYKNTSGLLGACQLMSRSTYATVGRYDERYLLVCSDIGICLEACRAGLRNIYTPYAVLIHDESTTAPGNWRPERRPGPGRKGGRPARLLRRPLLPSVAQILRRDSVSASGRRARLLRVFLVVAFNRQFRISASAGTRSLRRRIRAGCRGTVLNGTWTWAMASRQDRCRSGNGRELHPPSFAHGHVAARVFPQGPFRRAPRRFLPVALFAGGLDAVRPPRNGSNDDPQGIRSKTVGEDTAGLRAEARSPKVLSPGLPALRAGPLLSLADLRGARAI